jgi:copper chaperone NosL
MGKKHILCLTMVCCLAFSVLTWAQPQDDIALHKSCSNCGMSRERFDASRMVIEFTDGTVAAVCSIRCAADEMTRNAGKTPKSIKVADFNGRQLIDAEKAFWVIGGTRPGVMSMVGKWAFGKKEDAETFMKTNGGRLATFGEALSATREEIAAAKRMSGGKGRMNPMKPMEGGNK